MNKQVAIMNKQVERIIYVLGGVGNILRVYDEGHGVFVDIYKKELVKEKYMKVAGIYPMIGGGDLRHLFYRLNINNEEKIELEMIIWSLSENKELLRELDMKIKRRNWI